MTKNDTMNMLEKLKGFFKQHGINTEEALELLKQCDDKTIAAAWSYTEITTKTNETYSFKEALAWIQKYFDPTIHSAASITKKEKEGQHIVLYGCFLDKDKNPLTKPGDPFLKVITNEICQDFKDNFGDKDMILLQ